MGSEENVNEESISEENPDSETVTDASSTEGDDKSSSVFKWKKGNGDNGSLILIINAIGVVVVFYLYFNGFLSPSKWERFVPFTFTETGVVQSYGDVLLPDDYDIDKPGNILREHYVEFAYEHNGVVYVATYYSDDVLDVDVGEKMDIVVNASDTADVVKVKR